MPPPQKWVDRPKGNDLQQWWKDNHVIQSYKRPVTALSSVSPPAVSSTGDHSAACCKQTEHGDHTSQPCSIQTLHGVAHSVG